MTSIRFVTRSALSGRFDVRTDMERHAIVTCGDCGRPIIRIDQADRDLLFRSIGWFVAGRCPGQHVEDAARELGMSRR